MSYCRKDSDYHHHSWQQQLSDAFTSVASLCEYLGLDEETLPISDEAIQNFPLRVPRHFADCMEKGNPGDPLLRQVLPVADELTNYSGFGLDPVGDTRAVTEAGLLQKYQGRVLMINTGTCAINCRYCFRRNFPYRDHQLSKQKEAAALEAVQQDEVISEIILSGGDPLLLSDQRLSRLLIDLSGVPHLRRIRIHSRLPIVLPARITQALIRLLENSQRPVVMVVHCNHPREINQHVTEACGKLKQAGVSLFNQSVLLKGVNDHAEVLCELSEKLFDNGVTPYYLHQLDKAAGTGHFEVARQAAVNLINEMQNRLPGYLVPKLVFEQAGASSKLFVADYLTDV